MKPGEVTTQLFYLHKSADHGSSYQMYRWAVNCTKALTSAVLSIC
jgi:hypothetical protein